MGSTACLAMRKAAARTLGQDAPTSAVYGMPKAAFEIGAVEQQVPVGGLARAVLALCNNHSRGRADERA